MICFLFLRFEAAKLVMQWLCNHEDQNMQRMAVAIISILAAKVHSLCFCSVFHALYLQGDCEHVYGFAVVYRTDSSAGSRAVHCEGMILISDKVKAFSFSVRIYSKKKLLTCSLWPAATASHRASESESKRGGRDPQVYAECTVEPYRRVTHNLPPFHWEPGFGSVH